MAKDKKSFVLYCDLIHTVEHLNTEERGLVFTWILDYVNDKNPEPLPGLLKAVVEPVKQQLKRDLKKYESICERNKINGKKGGRPKKPKKPTGFFGNPKKPKKADSDNDTDSDNENDNEIILKSFEEFWKLYDYNSEKRKCQSEWNSMTTKQREQAIKHAPKYVRAYPDKKFRKKPYNYLTNECWLDEVPEVEERKLTPYDKKVLAYREKHNL